MGLFTKMFKKKVELTEEELMLDRIMKIREEVMAKYANVPKETMTIEEEKYNLSEEELKWNKMWDLWADEKLEEPINSLLTYDSAIQGEGHYGFFDNLDDEKEIKNALKNLKKILSDEMYANLEEAYENYKKLEDGCEECDYEGLPPYDVFYYDHEEEIENILKEYASKIEL